jgi:hypothetical protein
MNSPNNGLFNVLDFGATPNQDIDCSNSIQDAIQAAYDNGGGVVFFPTGHYALYNGIVVYEGVRLQGEVDAIQDIHNLCGAAILAYANEGLINGAPLFTMNGASSVSGLSVYYPNQIIPPQWPEQYSYIVYPYTFFVAGANCTIENITLYNSYRGILCGSKELGICSLEHRIRNVSGTVLDIGIKVDYCIDVGRIENIHFIPAYWAYVNVIEQNIRDKNHAWVQKQVIKSLVAYSFGHTDWEYVRDTFVWCAKTGYLFYESYDEQQSNPGSMNGQMCATSCDRVRYGYVINYLQKDGILVTNSQINANAPRSTGQENYGVVVNDSCVGSIRMTCCSFFGYQDRNVFFKGKGFLGLSNCYFENYETNTCFPQIESYDGKIQVMSCSFATYIQRYNIQISTGTISAIVCCNNSTSMNLIHQNINGLRIVNSIGVRAIISNNEVFDHVTP